VSHPFTLQTLIVKSLDEAQAGGPGNPNNVLPFLIPFQNLRRELLEHPSDSSMFVNLPHTVIILYYIRYNNSVFDSLTGCISRETAWRAAGQLFIIYLYIACHASGVTGCFVE
jgi:hypothetical protein